MGKGLGTTQKDILAALKQQEQNAVAAGIERGWASPNPWDWGLTIAELAERFDRSPRQIRTAVHALVNRGLAWTVKADVKWKTINEGTDDEFGMPVMGLYVFTPAARLVQLRALNEERHAMSEMFGEVAKLTKLIEGRGTES
jgi:hypothetical protein